MAKPPPTIQRFRIFCEVAVPDLGPVSVALAHISGLTVTGQELITDVITFRKKSNHDVKAEDFLIDWMADHPTFKAKEAIEHFRANGRTDGSGYTALRVLVERKLLRKLGEGQYSRIDVKHLPAPKKAKAARQEVSHRDFILRAASRNHGRFNLAWLKKQFVADGRTPGNASPSVTALLGHKQIKRVGNGEYVLLQKATASKTNSAQPAEVTTNG